MQSFMSFLLLPLYTSQLSTSQFGKISLVNSVASLLLIFFLFGTQSVISRLYFEYKDDEEKLKRFLGTVFLSKLIWNVCLTALLLLGRSYIFPIIGKGVEFYPFMLIALGIGFFSSIFRLYQVLLQTQQSGAKYAYAQIAYLILNNGISVLLLVAFRMKDTGIILGTLISEVLMFIYTLFKLRKKISFVIDREILKEVWAFSWPIFLDALFGWCLGSINKLILNNLVSVDIVGIYTIGFTIAGIVNMGTVALNRSYTPWFFGKMKKGSKDGQNLVRFSEFVTLIYSVAALGLSLFSREIVSLFIQKSYNSAWMVIPFLSFGYVFYGLYFFFLNIFNYQKKTVKYIPLYTLLSALINVALNYILIPHLGMAGSACASLISMFLLSLFTYLGSKKFINLGYSYKRMFFLIFIPFLFSCVSFVVKDITFESVLFKVVYFVLCTTVLYLVNRSRLGSSVKKQINSFKKYLFRYKNREKRD